MRIVAVQTRTLQFMVEVCSIGNPKACLHCCKRCEKLIIANLSDTHASLLISILQK